MTGLTLPLPVSLDDYLAGIRDMLAAHAHEGIDLTAEQVCDLVDALGHAQNEAARLEATAARNHRLLHAHAAEQAAAVAAELSREGTNVERLNIVPRPVPSGGGDAA